MNISFYFSFLLLSLRKVLVAEAKRCESMVADEVGKVKAEMGIEIGQLKALIEKQSEQLKLEVEIREVKSTQ